MDGKTGVDGLGSLGRDIENTGSISRGSAKYFSADQTVCLQRRLNSKNGRLSQNSREIKGRMYIYKESKGKDKSRPWE